VSAQRIAVRDWLFSDFTSRFAAAFETMTGDRPEISRVEAGDLPLDGGLRWRQPFSGVQGAIWIVAAEPDWVAAGGCVVRAAGLAEEDPSKLKSEYLEILNQTLAGIAQTMAERAGREVVSQGGEESGSSAPEILWASVQVRLGEMSAKFAVGLESALVDEFVKSAAPEIEAVPQKASTFDLLFDVELPVSVSFGRAQVALKDVLKLTTGSIIELNRAIVDPVEVIVNNCVIARGEVVVVEGNFGVRIQQVISRQERLRTLT
jgi:flagellar motor switch protein FliN/FliY